MTIPQGFQFHQLVQIPRPPQRQHPDAPDPIAMGLMAALTGTHTALLATQQESAAVATAWIRPVDARQLRFLLGGRPFFPPALDTAPGDGVSTRRPALFPPGAVVADLPNNEVAGLLKAFPYWLPCLGRPDSLWETNQANRQTDVPRGSFDHYAAHLRQPFAWLVHARPLRPEQLKPELSQLVNDILPLARGEVSEAKRVELERKQARHRELSRHQTGGLWQVQVLVGATQPRHAQTAAAMLCAAADLHDLPYVLEPHGQPEPLQTLLDDDTNQASFTASSRLVMALTRPPVRELPGVRLVQPHTFDVTPDTDDSAGIGLGTILDVDTADVGDFRITPDSLNRHTFVCGATGTGKSQTVRHLLEQATHAGVPWLVIEPAKAEYARMATRIAHLGADVIVIRPNDPDQPPAGLNPLEPAPGFPLQTHADLLRALFLASFEAQEPFPQILTAALTRCYEQLGWDLTLGTAAPDRPTPRYPTLADLQHVAEAVVQDIGYGREVADNVRGFIKVRLGSLRMGTTGRFFEGGHPINFDQLYRRNIVLEIEDIGDDASKAFFMGVILIRLTEHLRTTNRHRQPQLRHLTVIEEAHRLLRRHDGNAGPVAHAVEMFAALLAEIRAYGEGLIIAEQIPSKLISDVIKNTAVKILHRLPALDDRNAVGATMNVNDEQSEYVVTLPNGQAAAFTDGMDRPILIRMPDGTTREATATATPAPIHSIIGRRSTTCSADCSRDPCTLRALRTAQRLLVEQPWITIWAELAAIAHLTGHHTPTPTTDTIEQSSLADLDSRLLRCTFSQAVDHATRERTTVLQPITSVPDLASHVLDAMLGSIDGQPHTCGDQSWKYLSAVHKWAAVYQDLQAIVRDDAAGPHPLTSEWQQRYNRLIHGDNAREQLNIVTEWLTTDLSDAGPGDVVAFGCRRPSSLEQAVGAPATTPQWRERLRAALHPFTPCTWPTELLDYSRTPTETTP